MDKDWPKVTVLTEYFYPEEASTAQLLTSLTTELTDQFDVSVLTALPSYHDEDRTMSPPRLERYQGTTIRRVRATRFDKDRLPLRLVNWLSFTFLVLLRLVITVRDDDVRLVLSNPPLLPFATWVVKRLQGIPYVYVVHDVYPEMPVQIGYLAEDGILARIWHQLMKALYHDADRIVVLGKSMKRHLVEKLDDDPQFDPGKIHVVPNWEDPSFIKPKPKEENSFAKEYGTNERFTLLYSGNIGRFHELETAIDAIGILEERGRTDIQLLVIGEGAREAELREYVDSNDIDNVFFLPFQPKERLPETLTCGDASLVGIRPEMEGLCVSSKLYSSLAAGLPILAVVGENDEVARVVREYECGAWVRSGDAEAAADILSKWSLDSDLAAALGEHARQTLEREFSQRQALKRYKHILSEVA